MQLLVTGSLGMIGRWTVKRLLEAGHTLRTLDRTAQPNENSWEHLPGDIRDLNLVRRAVQGVEAVVHLAAIPFDIPNSEELIFTTNLQGTWNILLACAEAGVKRVVNFSSINALGHAEEEPNPAMYLPLDDDVPHYMARAYNTTKHVGEEVCQAFANAHGLTVISLRPSAVLEPHGARERWWDFMPEERKAFWSTKDFWSYVDVRDVAEAALLGLTAPVEGHEAFLLAAEDSSGKIPTAEIVAKYYPNLPWPRISSEVYLANHPFRSLLDCSKAKRLLGWQPKISLRDPGSGYKFL
jgi:nucleoside-diphosphate-sugar epimerase